MKLIDTLEAGPVVEGRWSLLQHCFPKIPREGLVMEFGVYQGHSIRMTAKAIHPTPVYGFDSFEGLPQAWHRGGVVPVLQKGHFTLDKKPPQGLGENVTLVPGWFEESLPPFLKTHPGDAAFIDIDCDLYSSAITVLTLLNPRIVPGTLIYFDELGDWKNTYPKWAEHEYRALLEWMAEHDREVEPIIRNDDWAALVKVIR